MAVVMLPLAASAQTASSTTELEPVTVTGEQPKKAKKAPAKKAPAASAPAAPTPQPQPSDGGGPSTASATGAVNGYVAKATTTGSKTATDITEVPQFVSVVGRNEIDDQGAQKVDEALRYTSGVFAQPFGNDTDTNWLFIRGFQATQTGVYQDGLQLYSHAFGAFYIDSFALERIEVLKGPAAVLYGGSNPGGIVNYVSKRPTGERLRYLEAGINDAGNAYLGFDVGDQASSVLDYRVTGRIAGGDGYSDFQDDGFRGFISPTLTWSDNRTSFTLLANYSNIDETHGGGTFLPYVGTVVPASFGYIPRDANYTEPGLDKYEREQGSIGYEFEHKLTDDLTVRQNARYGAADINEVQLYPNGYATADSLNRVYWEHDTTISTFLLDNQVEWKTRGPFADHTVLAGVDYKYFNIDQVQAAGLWSSVLNAGATPISVLNPIYGAAQPALASYTNQDLTQEQIGAYIQDQIRFGGGWLVTLNGRYDWVSTEVHDGPTYWDATQNKTTKNHDGEASGRAGIAYTFANGLTPYASAATYFNPVIGTTYQGDLFEPETGQQYEVGIKYAPRFIDAIITASLFDLTRQNVLTRHPDAGTTPPGSSSPIPDSAQVQTGEVNSRGFEIEAKANLTEQLRVTAAFTALDLEITKDNNAALVGNQPYIVPEVMASFFADYTFHGTMLDGVSIGGGVRYLGSSYADNENTRKVPDVTLFDARIGYDWGGWGIDLNVTNIFDEKYVASCQGLAVCSYGEGRVVKLKSHVTW